MFYHERLISIPTAKVPPQIFMVYTVLLPSYPPLATGTTLTHSAQAVTTKGAMPPCHAPLNFKALHTGIHCLQ